MRHATFFSTPPLTSAIAASIVATVLVLGSAGFAFGGVKSLWALLVDPPVISASAQCNCLNNATNLSNGQFADTITIESDPGETWTITAASGLFSPSSPAPPAAPVPIPVGTVIPETAPGSGIYRLAVIHVDATGFSVTASNGIDPPLSLTWACNYPNPQILNLPSQVCVTTPPITLQGTAGAGVAGSGTFTINGAPATVFNPNTLGPGSYIVGYTFNAGAGTPNDPNDPACTATVTQSVQVVDIPTLAAITFLNVPLNNQCFAVITPGMILSDLNIYPCPDDFVVTVFDVPGNPIGDTIGSEWVGFTLRAEVTSLNGGFSVESFLTFFDDLQPNITCPPNATTGVVTQTLQTVNGALTNTDPSIVLSNYVCFTGQTNPAMDSHRYDTYVFTVSAADTYIFELDPQFGRGVGVLYQGAFNPDFPCMNVIDMADDGVLFIMPDSIIRLSAHLVPNQSYTLFTSSQTPGVTGAYQWRIFSDGPGVVNNLAAVVVRDTFELVCNDTDSIFNNSRSLSITGAPIAVDNCGPVTVTFSDSRQNNGDCGPQIITRTFTATDGSGNTRTCQQTITVRKPRISDLRFPPFSTVIDCSSGFQTLPNGNPHPSATGFPYIETAFGIYRLNPIFCNLAATWQDGPRVDENSPNVYSFVRQWTVLDQCNPSQFSTYNQIIRVGDFSPPVITCPPSVDTDDDGIPDPRVFSTTNTECTAIVVIPPPQITDDCSTFTYETQIVTDVQVPVLGPQGQVIGFNVQTQVLATIPAGGSPVASGIPIGNHRFRYTATDAHGNMSRVECPFSVVDDVPPVAVCDDNLVVAIGNNYGRVFAQDVNEGSTDNCGIASIEVRRRFTRNPETCLAVTPYYSPWGPFVEVSCCDVGSTVIVELRVTDVNGNSNICVSELSVLDNTRPVCIAPPPVSIGCDALPAAFNPADTAALRSLFGWPIATDNCSGAVIEALNPIVNMGDCGSGTIVRRFRAIDASGNISSNTCQQVITINLVHNYNIRFPKDASAECGAPQADSLFTETIGCDLLAVSTQNEVFTSSADACYKIMRTYRVINWCEYNGSDPPLIIGRDEDCNGHGGDEEVWVLRRPNQTYIDRNKVHNDNIPAANTRGLACGSPSNPAGYWRTTTSRGYWQYTQQIKVFDTSRPVVSFTAPDPACTVGTSCNSFVSVPFSVSDACSPNDIEVNVFLDAFSDGVLDGPVTGANLAVNYPNFTISGTFPIGNHRFVVNVRDGCGNADAVHIPFAVIDCGVATPVCYVATAAVLMPLPPNTDADGDGQIDIAAAMIEATTFVANDPPADCSGPVRYSINIAGQTPHPSQTSLVLTCAHLGTQILEIYSWDHADNPTRVQPNGSTGGPNFGSCLIFLVVQANETVNCFGGIGGATMGMIAGSIYNENGAPVESVEVDVSGNMTQHIHTESDGLYYAEDLPGGGAYTVTPHSDEDAVNGVSTLDLILITRHILGTQLLDSPYKLIAADANNSKSVTTLDLIQIRRVILGLTNSFPNNTSWRFIDAGFVFPNLVNPWQTTFPEVIQINDLQGELMGRNFIAVKTGDVNNSAIPNANTIEDRSIEGTFTLYANATDMEKGKELTVPVNARNWMGIEGFQMTVEFDTEKLEFLDVVFGVIGAEHIGMALVEQGMVTVSWNRQGNPFAAGADPAAEGEALFWLSFRPKTNGKIEQALAVSSRYTRAEAYDPQGALLDVVLQFERMAIAE